MATEREHAPRSNRVGSEQVGEHGPCRVRPPRVTDETLLRARRSPTTFAAWVLRSIVDELIDVRLSGATADLEFVGWRSPRTGNLFRPGPGSQKDWAADGYEPVYRKVPIDGLSDD